MAHPVFNEAFGAMLPIVLAAKTLIREYQTKRLYRMSSFFWARTTGELPITSMFPAIFTFGAFFFVGFYPRDEIWRLFVLYVMAWCLMLAASSFGFAIGSLTTDHDLATCILIVVIVIMMVLNGFLVDLHVLPEWVRWVRQTLAEGRLLQDLAHEILSPEVKVLLLNCFCTSTNETYLSAPFPLHLLLGLAWVCDLVMDGRRPRHVHSR